MDPKDTHILLETSGSLTEIWRWVVGIIGTGLIGLWGHVTGRIRKIEDNIVTSKKLDEHIEDENAKFAVLFEKHDSTQEKLSAIAEDVAFIRGTLKK